MPPLRKILFSKSRGNIEVKSFVLSDYRNSGVEIALLLQVVSWKGNGAQGGPSKAVWNSNSPSLVCNKFSFFVTNEGSILKIEKYESSFQILENYEVELGNLKKEGVSFKI